MSDPFFSVHCVARDLSEGFEPRREVYMLGPQFCGGDKHVIAHVFPEAVRDACVEDADLASLPEPVRNFIKWCNENVVIPKKV